MLIHAVFQSANHVAAVTGQESSADVSIKNLNEKRMWSQWLWHGVLPASISVSETVDLSWDFYTQQPRELLIIMERETKNIQWEGWKSHCWWVRSEEKDPTSWSWQEVCSDSHNHFLQLRRPEKHQNTQYNETWGGWTTRAETMSGSTPISQPQKCDFAVKDLENIARSVELDLSWGCRWQLHNVASM